MLLVNLTVRLTNLFTDLYTMNYGTAIILITIRLGRVSNLTIQTPYSINRMTIYEITDLRVSNLTNRTIRRTCNRLVEYLTYRQVLIEYELNTTNLYLEVVRMVGLQSVRL